MKMSIAGQVCAVVLSAQDYPAERKHLSVPIQSSALPFAVAANEIERGAGYPSVIHLRGAAEIRMPICFVTGPGAVQHCAGEMVLHADAVDLHEGTGQIEARGTVTITHR